MPGFIMKGGGIVNLHAGVFSFVIWETGLGFICSSII